MKIKVGEKYRIKRNINFDYTHEVITKYFGEDLEHSIGYWKNLEPYLNRIVLVTDAVKRSDGKVFYEIRPDFGRIVPKEFLEPISREIKLNFDE